LKQYDFRKTVQDPNHGEFQHLSFQQNRPDLLPNIKRKAHHKSSESSKKSEKGSGDGSDGTSIGQFVSASGALLSNTTKRESGSEKSYNHENIISYIQNKDPDHKVSEDDLKSEMKSVLNDLLQQKSSRDEFEKRIQDMEAESARVAGENLVLKSLVLDSRNKQSAMQEKMEKVLQTLYNMFMRGNNVALNNGNLTINSDGDSNEGKNNDLLPLLTEGSNILPLLTRSSPSSQMLENLIYRLDSMQTYGLKMGGGSFSGPDQIFDVAGSETMPISNIANDMMQLATSCKDSSYNNNDIGYIMNKNLTGSSNFLPYIDKPVTSSGGGELGQFGPNYSFDSLMGPSYSFDTLASRVSAPDLQSMAEECLTGAETNNETNDSQRYKNMASTGSTYIKEEPKNSYDSTISGGGSLMRQGSIYPGASIDNSPQPSIGFPLERLDSEFSWSSLFSINSIDGYGLTAPNISTLSHQLDSKLVSGDNEEYPTRNTKQPNNDIENRNYNTEITNNDEKNNMNPGDEMINENKDTSNFDESLVKIEKTNEPKRGILEYESSNTTDVESKRNVRQKSALHPPYHNFNDTSNNFAPSDAYSSSSSGQLSNPSYSSSSSSSSSSAFNPMSSSSAFNPLSPSSNASASAISTKSGSDILTKSRPETFYGNLQKQQGATLTRIDSLEQSISIFLKSIDSVDGCSGVS
jgi:hypothetical protein